jgi:hypothetical protein
MHDFESRTIESLVVFADDPKPRTWVEPATGSVFIDLNLSGIQRKLRLDEHAAHALGSVDDADERAKAVAALFEGNASWPDGDIEVRCIGDALDPTNMMTHTDLVVFVGDKPAGQGVRLSSASRQVNQSRREN